MAKKRVTTVTGEKRELVKTCAFWGLMISSVLYVASGVLSFIATKLSDVGAVLIQISSILSLVASVSLLVVIALPAYSYVRGKSRGWKIAYWIALAIYVLGVVFGILR